MWARSSCRNIDLNLKHLIYSIYLYTQNNNTDDFDTFLSFSDWQFVKGSMMNGTAHQRIDGYNLLTVLFANSQTGLKVNETICANNFNWRTANSFCSYFGYKQGNWDSETTDKIPE